MAVDRFDEANRLYNEVVEKALQRAEQSVGERSHAFALGYMSNLVVQLAAMSPKALELLRQQAQR